MSTSTPGSRTRALLVAGLAALAAVAGLALATRSPTGDDTTVPTADTVTAAAPARVLVFTKTEGYEHDSIGHGAAVLAGLGGANGFVVDTTGDATAFTPSNLAGYAAVVWLSTTGDVLDATQQQAFEGYIRSGGGYVGVHAASDTEYDWPWYGELVGAWFDRHPVGVHRATIDVEDAAHPSTASLPAHWSRTDEWYDFKRNPRPFVHVLATLDESTYSGGGMGADHPIAWCRAFDGGRSWYTALGHRSSAFDEQDVKEHLVGGIRWAAGLTGGGCGTTPVPPPPTTSPTTSGTPTTPPVTSPGPGGGGSEGTEDTARFVPLAPARVLDTRAGLGAPAGPVPSDGTLDVVVAGQAGVPVGASAVALTVTATEATGAGYVSAWPAGTPRPIASVLNLERPGQTIAGMVVVPLGTGGAVSLYAQTATHLVADVAGYWLPSGPAAAGRFVAVDPARLVDTREAPAAPLASDGELAVTVAGRAGVPVSGVGAVVLNVTATGAQGAGYLTAWPGGSRPLASNLNVERVGQTIANAVVVPVGADGRVHLYAQTATDVVVDVTGWFTDASAPTTGDGLFVPTSPTRLLDTRTDTPAGGVYRSAALVGGEGAELVVAGVGPVPATGVRAVVATVTATGAAAAGYVTVSPGGAPRPLASTVNVDAAGQTIANLAVVRVGAGRLGLYAQSTLDLVVDVSGWFTGPT